MDSNYLQFIRTAYFAQPKPNITDWDPKDGKAHVAIHLRRGDVPGARFCDNTCARRCLIHLRYELLSMVDFDVHIYSEGKMEDFAYISDCFPKVYVPFPQKLTIRMKQIGLNLRSRAHLTKPQALKLLNYARWVTKRLEYARCVTKRLDYARWGTKRLD